MPRTSAMPAQPNPLADHLPEYRARLEEQWRQQAADLIGLSYESLPPSSGTSEDDGSLIAELHVNSRLIAAARQQLDETEAALARIDDGTYGLCGGCWQPVNPERLEILPAARYCVPCQGRHGRRR